MLRGGPRDLLLPLLLFFVTEGFKWLVQVVLVDELQVARQIRQLYMRRGCLQRKYRPRELWRRAAFGQVRPETEQSFFMLSAQV